MPFGIGMPAPATTGGAQAAPKDYSTLFGSATRLLQKPPAAPAAAGFGAAPSAPQDNSTTQELKGGGVKVGKIAQDVKTTGGSINIGGGSSIPAGAWIILGALLLLGLVLLMVLR